MPDILNTGINEEGEPILEMNDRIYMASLPVAQATTMTDEVMSDEIIKKIQALEVDLEAVERISCEINEVFKMSDFSEDEGAHSAWTALTNALVLTTPTESLDSQTTDLESKQENIIMENDTKTEDITTEQLVVTSETAPVSLHSRSRHTRQERPRDVADASDWVAQVTEAIKSQSETDTFDPSPYFQRARHLLARHLGEYRYTLLEFVGDNLPGALEDTAIVEYNSLKRRKREAPFIDQASAMMSATSVSAKDVSNMLDQILMDVPSYLSYSFIRFVASNWPSMLSESHLNYVVEFERVQAERRKKKEELTASRQRVREEMAIVRQREREESVKKTNTLAEAVAPKAEAMDLVVNIAPLIRPDREAPKMRPASSGQLEQLSQHFNTTQRVASLLGGGLKFAMPKERLENLVETPLSPTDGDTHLNCSYSGRTPLGRWLDINAHAPFEHPVLGHFDSVGGLFYYIQSEHPAPELRSMSGMAVKRAASQMAEGRSTVPNFRQIVAEATLVKVLSNQAMMEALALSTHPLKSYTETWKLNAEGVDEFVERSEIKHLSWYVNALEEIRRAVTAHLKTGKPVGEFYDFEGLSESRDRTVWAPSPKTERKPLGQARPGARGARPAVREERAPRARR